MSIDNTGKNIFGFRMRVKHRIDQNKKHRKQLRGLSYEQLEARALLSADLASVNPPTLDDSSSVPLNISWFESFNDVARVPLDSLASVDRSLPEGVSGPIEPAIGEWIIQLTDSAAASLKSLSQANLLLSEGYGQFTIISGLGTPGSLLVRGQGASSQLIESSLTENKNVTSFSLNQLIKGQAVSNDPELTGGLLVGIDKIDARSAWDVSRGSSTTVVGVVDTGIDATHADLYLNIWLNQGELPPKYLDDVGPKLVDVDGDGLITFYDLNNLRVTPGGIVVHSTGFLATLSQLTTNTPFASGPNASFVIDKKEANGLGNGRIEASDLLADPNWADGRDTDNNGFFDDFFGVNFRAGAGDPFTSNNPLDELGHGTHVAGTIGATGNNGTGVVGVNWQTSLMSLRILDNNNQGDSGAAIRAINYASMMRERMTFNSSNRLTQGANVRVLNNSWGQPGGYEVSLEAAIRDTGDAGILFVAAAGNGNLLGQGVDNDRTPFYPANYESPNVIAVAASDATDQLAAFSNFGKSSVDILAPGIGIRSTLPGSRYGSANGTSMATPHVAGTAALVWSLLPEATVDEVRQAIIGSRDILSNAVDNVASGGRLNAFRPTIADVFAPSAKLIAKQDVTSTSAPSVEFIIQYRHQNGIEAASIGENDVVVQRKWGPQTIFNVALKPGAITSTPTSLNATYVLTAPGGSWDPLDFGNYEVSLRSGGVLSRLSGQPTQAQALGTFNVRIDNPSVLYVTNLGDSIGPGTLRTAITTANSRATATTIILEAGVYPIGIAPVPDPATVFTLPSARGSGVVAPDSTIGGWSNQSTGDFDITGNVSIVGDEPSKTIINARGLDRVFKVHPGAQFSLTRVTATGGTAPIGQPGGGILSAGNLNLVESVVSGNRTSSSPNQRADGGGIAVIDGQATISGTRITANRANASAGVLFAGDATGLIQNSTVDSNVTTDAFNAPTRGAGIGSYSTGAILVENTTISGNLGIAAYAGWNHGLLDATGSFNNQDSVAVSDNGRFVAFSSGADNLVPDDRNVQPDVFLFDRDADTIIRITRGFDGSESNGGSYEVVISADGNFVAFSSNASNLVSNDTNETLDVFVYNRTTRTIERASLSATGLELTDSSGSPSISSDGRFLAFSSFAKGVAGNDDNDFFDPLLGGALPSNDIYRRDRVAGTTLFVSDAVASNSSGRGQEPSISADGSKIAFGSTSITTIFDEFGNFFETYSYPILLKDITTNVTTTIDASGLEPSVSGDGAYVAYVRNNNGTPVGVYRHRLSDGLSTLVSSDSNGVAFTRPSRAPSISFDGSRVAFTASVLESIPTAPLDVSSVYVKNLIGGSTNLIRAGAYDATIDYAGTNAVLSSNGNNLAFASNSQKTNNLANGDLNRYLDVISYDLTTDTFVTPKSKEFGKLTLNNVTLANNTGTVGATGRIETGNSLFIGNSGLESVTKFGKSLGRNLFDTSNVGPFKNALGDIFDFNGKSKLSLLTRFNDTTLGYRLLAGSAGINGADIGTAPVADQRGTVRNGPDIGSIESNDGTIAGFLFIDLDGDEQFDREEKGLSGVTVFLDENRDGVFQIGESSTVSMSNIVGTIEDETGFYHFPGVAPAEYAIGIVVPNGISNVPRYYHTISSDGNPLLSLSSPAISRDGTLIALETSVSVDLPDSPSRLVVTRYDTRNGQQQVLTSSGSNARFPSITDDGAIVVVSPLESSFGITIPSTLGSVSSPSISRNGRYIVFLSSQTYGLANDSNGFADIFRFDTQTNQILRISNRPDGAAASSSNAPSISSDGSFVTFQSFANGLVSGDVDNRNDIFVFATSTGTVSLVSPSLPGIGVQGNSIAPSISDDGRWVAFASDASDLVPNDTNGFQDIFVHDRQNGVTRRISVTGTGAQANDSSNSPQISADGEHVVFESLANNLVKDDTNNASDTFVYEIRTGRIARFGLDSEGKQIPSGSKAPSISSTGRYAGFRINGNTTAVTINPLEPLLVSQTVTAGQDALRNLPLNPLPGSISGTVFDDSIENSGFDLGEEGQSNWLVFIDRNQDGFLNAGEISTTTDVSGNYTFDKVPSEQTHFVAVDIPSGWTQVTPNGSSRFRWEINLRGGASITGRDFGFRRTSSTGQSSASSVSGRLFDDKNNDKVFNDLDVAYANREVYLDASNLGVRDPDEPRVLTDANGFYTIGGLSSRNVAVTAVLDPSLVQLSPIGSDFSVQRVPLYPSVTPFGNPQSIAAGDFNQDGFQDVAVTLGEANRLSIRLNDQRGGFTSEVIDVELGKDGTLPTSLVVGQFDSDARLDVALTAQFSSKVLVLLNFNPTTKTFTSVNAVNVGILPSDIVAGQFAGDARSDLVIVNRGAGATASSIQVLVNNGIGGFSANPAIPTGGSSSISLVAGNFVGDASLDVVIVHASPTTPGSPNGGVSVFRGNAAGGLTRESTSYQVGAFPIDASTADFNGDGRLDIAVANFSSNSISILLGQANGTFRVQSAILGTASGAFDIAVGDVDNDNDVDVIASNLKDRNVSIFRNDGVNTANNDVIFQPLENIGLGQFSVAQRMPLVVANFDKDTSGPGGTGTLDIVTIPQQTDTLHVLKNNLKNGSRRVALTGLNQMTGIDFIIKSAVASPSFNAISNPSPIIEDAVQQSLQITGVTDGGSLGTTLQFTALSSNPALIPNPTVTLAGGTNPATLRYQPVPNAFGTAVITVRAINVGANQIFGDDGIFERSFTVTVIPVNDRPTAAFPLGRTVTVNEDTGAQLVAGFVNGITVGGGAFEASQFVQPLIVVAATPSLFQVQPAIDATGRLTFTGAANANGTSIVTLTIKDNGGNVDGGSDTLVEQFTIVLNAINDAPSISIGGNQSAKINSGAKTVTGFATGFLPGSGTDEATQTVVEYLVTNDNPSIFASQPTIESNGVLRYTPSATLFGTANVNVRVRDNGGTVNGGVDLSATKTFSITIQSSVPVIDTIDLSTLASQGMTIFGADANDQSGYSVSSAGDVNGDGFDDLIIGARYGDALNNAKANTGETYIIFGKATPPATIDLANLGTAGVTIFGTDAADQNGRSVSSAGDVNGDGFDDLIVGSLSASAAGNLKLSSGESYLIFGKAVFSSTIDLATLGTAGITIFGADPSDTSGRSLSSAGDVNGDGFDDLIIGADLADASANAKADAGESYLIFGAATLPTTIDLALLSATAGVRIYGADAADRSGLSVSGAGDVNADGFDDLIVGAFGADASANAKSLAGDSYLIYGAASLPSAIDLAVLGSLGVTIFGTDANDQSGRSVSGAGDVNGDGFDDVLIGAFGGDASANTKSAAGDSYVIFGGATLPATIDLASLGAAGITIFGVDVNDFSAISVSNAGDVNADGFDDLIIGAFGGDAAGNSKLDAGESYVLFGRAAPPSTIDLATFRTSSVGAGFAIFGADVSDQSGNSVSNAGDVNGDGFDDLIVGAFLGDSVGNARVNAGESYVIFGGNGFTASITHPGTPVAETLTGTVNPDLMVGGNGNDIVIGNGGADVISGGQGNDILAVSDLNFQRIVGGTGNDTLRLDGGNLLLNLTTLRDNRLLDIETIDLTGSGNNSLILKQRDVLNLSSSSNTLTVRGNTGDRLEMEPGWVRTASQVVGVDTFLVFTRGAATLRVLLPVVVQITMDLASLGAAGTTIFGAEANDQSGFSVSNAGDVNGDGFEDMIIGARYGDGFGNAKVNAGESYLVYGSPSLPSTIDLLNLGSAGITFIGAEAGDNSGHSVSSAGDINGDGFADLLIGAISGDAIGNTKASAGDSYVIFGAATLPALINIASLTTPSGVPGVILVGGDANDTSGRSVSSAGDVNADGFDDLIIGANGADASGNLKADAGESYIVFGAATLPTVINFASLGTAGVTIFGADAGDQSGFSVNNAGDVNGDGFDDLIIGAFAADASGNAKLASGDSYVVFGGPALPSTINLASLGTAGFTIFGAEANDGSGRSVSSAGDVNGDGFDDILIGAHAADALNNTKPSAGDSYLIYGSATPPASIDLSALGTAGMTIYGVDTNDGSGISVSSAGDVNGDGLDDLIIGAWTADALGNAKPDAGDSYVVFGSATLPSTIDLATFGTVGGASGFTIYGAGSGDLSGSSVSTAGDVNGDGFDDLLVGAFLGDALNNLKADTGESYVIFGGNSFTSSVTHLGTSNSETITGTAGNNVMNGGRGNDTLIGSGGADFLNGGQGNDILAVNSLNFKRINGGTGSDTLRLDGTGLTLNLTTLRDNRLLGIETIDITGSGNNTLVLDKREVLNLSDESNTLIVRRNTGDVVTMGSGWVQGANQTINSVVFNVFTQGAATLKIAADTPLAPQARLAAIESEAPIVEPVTDEVIYIMPSPRQNATDRFDVNKDGGISPVDVLVVINALRRYGSASDVLTMIEQPEGDFDVDGDFSLSPVDVLQVINHMNRRIPAIETNDQHVSTFDNSSALAPPPESVPSNTLALGEIDMSLFELSTAEPRPEESAADPSISEVIAQEPDGVLATVTSSESDEEQSLRIEELIKSIIDPMSSLSTNLTASLAESVDAYFAAN